MEPKYEEIKSFVNSHARFKQGSSWGLLDTKGKVIVPAEYDAISDYSKNGIWGKKGESFGVIVNQKFIPLEGVDKIWDYSSDSKLTYARSNKKLGYIDAKGNWVIEPTYEKARGFVNGLAPVFMDKSWGYINEKGEKVIDFKYRDAEIFSKDGLAPVKDNKMWGFIDKTGKLVIPMDYEKIGAF